jgi:RNA binding exosome subunit
LASRITGQEGHVNNTGSNTGKLLPRSVESFGVVGSKDKERTSVSRVNEKSGQLSQHNHATEKGKDKTRVLNVMSPQVGPAERHSTGIHGSNVVGLLREISKGVPATTAAAQQKRSIAPSADASQLTEQVDQHSDGSSHSAYGEGDSMSTKQMIEKKNGSSNNFHSRMDKQLLRGKNGEVQGNAKIKEVKANHQKGFKDGDRGQNVDHKAVQGRARDHNAVKARDGNKGKVNGKSATHKQKREELVGHGANKNYIHEMDLAHLNGNKFTSDDAKKRKDLHTNSSLHGEFFVLIYSGPDLMLYLFLGR